MSAKPGDRVGAVSHIDGEVVHIFGFGVYEGDFVPEPGITFMGLDMNKLQHKNPRIKLDSGDTVFGCECWWGSEAAVKDRISKCKRTVEVDIETARAAAKKA